MTAAPQPNTETVVADLAAWSAETGAPLILPPTEIAWREHCGMVVDLTTGASVYPAPHFVDFARRWRDYRQHFFLTTTPAALAAAYRRAFADQYRYPDPLWQTSAAATLHASQLEE